MRTLRTITLCIIILVITLTGCGTTSKEIQAKSQSERSDVFTETRTAAPLPADFADLLIRAHIKTPLDGYYFFESHASLHGKPGYPFLINIDSQAMVWKLDGFKDSSPLHETDGKTSREQEAGEGMKYVLEKRLKLRAGQHRIFFGLPEENYSATTDIVLKSGEKAILEYKPVYRYKTFPTRIRTFLEGISRYEVFLNGKQL
jgi:hypothetical protein